MRAMLGIILIVIIFVAGCKEQTPPPSGQAVGLVRLGLTDSLRQNWEGTEDRPIVTSIWYPAEDGSEMTEVGIPRDRPVFIGGFAGRKAALSEEHKTYPLILMSHGTGGAAMQMMWLARSFAEDGYIVAAVDHHGNTAAEAAFDPRGFRMPWERARDISAVLDHLMSDTEWGPRIKTDHIGAVGFSLGGYTVTALAGGQINLAQFEAFCNSENRDATCDEQSEFPEAGKRFDSMLAESPELAEQMEKHRKSFKDARIKAVIALAPALGQAFTGDSLEGITIPYLAIGGSADDIAPLETNAQFLANRVPDARLNVVSDAGHYVFLNTCNKRGRRYVPVCKDPSGVQRSRIHDEVSQKAVRFFDNVFNREQAPQK